MTIEDAIKSIGSYFHLQNFVVEHNFLFGDVALRVILSLISRLDYSLKNTVVVMSYTELQNRTGKGRGVLQKAIDELIVKGFILKISGKYESEFARYQRERLYQQPQKPLRSYNEINAYDLKGLILVAALHYKLIQFYEKSLVMEFFYQVRRYYEKIKKSIMEMIAGAFYSSPPDMPLGICLISISQKEMYLLGTSDIPNRYGDIPNRYIRYTYLGKIPQPYSLATDHTHTPAPHTATESDLEGRTLATNGGRAIFKQEGQAIEGQSQEQAQNNILPSTPMTQPKKKKGKEEKMGDELRKFILDDLLAQEKEGKINSANAVMKRLTDEDIELYRQKLDAWKKEQEKMKEATQRAAWKVMSFLADYMNDDQKMQVVFGENWREAFEKKRQRKELKEYGYYVYVKVKKEKVEEILEKARSQMMTFSEHEYDKDYERFFNS